MFVNTVKVCAHESFIFFEGENECDTERFHSEIGSMISVVRNDDCVSPLCSRHV